MDPYQRRVSDAIDHVTRTIEGDDEEKAARAAEVLEDLEEHIDPEDDEVVW